MAIEIPSKLSKTLTGKIQVNNACPGCGLELNNSLDEAGNKDTCPGCGTSFVVPGEAKRIELEKQKAEEEEKKRQEVLQHTKDVEQSRRKQIELQRQAEHDQKASVDAQQKKPDEIKVKKQVEEKTLVPHGKLTMLPIAAAIIIVLSFCSLGLFTVVMMLAFFHDYGIATTAPQQAAVAASCSAMLIGGYVFTRCIEKVVRAISRL